VIKDKIRTGVFAFFVPKTKSQIKKPLKNGMSDLVRDFFHVDTVFLLISLLL